MKRFLIIGLVIVLITVIVFTTPALAAWSSRQNKAHEIAEMARSIGLPEDDPIIKRAQEIWWEDYYNPPPSEPSYDICYECCGKIDGITASGAKATVGRTIAAPSNLPFGTKLYIEGIGERIVEDRGGSISGQRLDLLCNNHSECYAITGYYEVYIIK